MSLHSINVNKHKNLPIAAYLFHLFTCQTNVIRCVAFYSVQRNSEQTSTKIYKINPKILNKK